MLQPIRTKFRKAHKGRIHGNAKGGTSLNFGSFGLKAVEPFYEKTGLKKLPIYLDPDMRFTRSSGVRGLPTTIVVDRGGQEVGRMEGDAAWDAPEAQALIRHYVAAKAAG